MSDDYIKNTIEEAIKNRKAISFTYDKPGDFAKGVRIGYPHALYYTKSTNKTKLDVYQISGDSTDRNSIPDWRPFDIKYIKTIEIIYNQTFNVQTGYNPNSTIYIDYIIKI